ncbi:hypothetical protein NDU88_007174 [Pleurodeles waltl]|uniref:Uncharacterized protein n=1 Tax=Pleurodeles waltl TaxID=8319 RepID=A0AAV7QK11_PLEWA|nr:hypothetical protein NDU88_007174 [Pleurodeles waltl]
MEGQPPFSEFSTSNDVGAFINEAVSKAVSASMSKMSKNLESSMQNMVFQSFLAQSAGDSRKRKNKDVVKQKDGALVGEVSSPLTEDDMPPRPPLKEGNIVNASGKRKSKVKNMVPAPKQVVITHISDTDEDIGDLDEDEEDSDAWGSLSQVSSPKKIKT